MEFNGASNGSAKSNANGGPKAAVARRPKANLSISGPVAWSLSLILIVWGLLLPLDHFTHKNGKGLTDDAPLLLSLRDSVSHQCRYERRIAEYFNRNKAAFCSARIASAMRRSFTACCTQSPA